MNMSRDNSFKSHDLPPPPPPASRASSVAAAHHQGQELDQEHQSHDPGGSQQAIRCWIHEDVKIMIGDNNEIKMYQWDDQEWDYLPLEWYDLNQDLAHHQASEVLAAISDPDPRRLIWLMFQWNTNQQLREQCRISMLASIGVSQIRAVNQIREGIWPSALRWGSTTDK